MLKKYIPWVIFAVFAVLTSVLVSDTLQGRIFSFIIIFAGIILWVLIIKRRLRDRGGT
jgi:hypothetical protein